MNKLNESCNPVPIYFLRGLAVLLAMALILALWSLLAHAAGSQIYTVDTPSDETDGACDDGDCSLRDAINLSNVNPGPDTIEFNIAGCPDNVCTIAPAAALPVLSGGETNIDGYTQTGAMTATDTVSATLKIVIDGSGAGEDVHGLEITSAGNKIEGLVIHQFSGRGIYLHDGSSGNTVAGNYIGTDVTGTTGMGNGSAGVFIGWIEGIATNNTIGGDAPAERNVISANDYDGITIVGSETMSNTISGNYIGTDANGMADLGNDGTGVAMWMGPQNNTIGGNTPGERNIISGNSEGVSILTAGTDGNIISGNYIGVDASGAVALGNSHIGVVVSEAQDTVIGGDGVGARNVISGNGSTGIYLSLNVAGTIITANYVGTNAGGTAALPNGGGIYLENGAKNTTIGGNKPALRNVISGNIQHGIQIASPGCWNNVVSGNYIGVGADGFTDLGNGLYGIVISYEARYNTVGGDEQSERNVISGNGDNGIVIGDARTIHNTISGNYIGTGASGNVDVGNDRNGVWLRSGAYNNTIGGDKAGEGNLISGNEGHGVMIEDAGTWNNTIIGNYIGTNAGGTVDLGNTMNGVYILNSAHNMVGPDNLIAYNEGDGVRVEGSSAFDNLITRNNIFLNDDGIALVDDANGEIDPPAITGTNLGSVSITGTACAHCTVEVFMNTYNRRDGEVFKGSTTAGANGNFTLNVQYLDEIYLTATATDVAMGTSEFSEVYEATYQGELISVYLPMALRNYLE